MPGNSAIILSWKDPWLAHLLEGIETVLSGADQQLLLVKVRNPARLPVNLLPEISYPTVTIETKYAGAAPGEVESLITRPIEEAVGIISGVQRLTSRSRSGLSQVTLEFALKTNMDLATLDSREKLDLVTLPRDAEKPATLRFDPASDPILRLGLSGGADLSRLRLVAEDEVKKELESIDGLASLLTNVNAQ